MTPIPSTTNFILLFGLAFFFGLAFEELNARGGPWRPGGIRTFPLLALTGALLYLLEPVRVVPFAVGLLVLGACLVVYYQRHLGDKDAEGRPNVTLALPFCNLLAYVLGPISLAAPPWIPVGVTVAAVLLLAERERLHRFAWRIPVEEIITAGKFLILTGLILPLLPREPVIPLTSVTPQQVWLAVLAVCTISYAGYLLQRYVVPSGRAGLLPAVLGGVYSSTATTVVLARRARTEPTSRQQAQTGIILATSVMYPRLLVIIFIFNRPLAHALALPLLGLSGLGLLMAAGWYWIRRPQQPEGAPIVAPGNPLELGVAGTFALLFIAVSIASTWAMRQFGAAGVYALAGIVGVSDINPFVLTLAQHGTSDVPDAVAVIAVLVATASNNLFQAAYAIAYSGGRIGIAPTVALAALAACGFGIAAVLA